MANVKIFYLDDSKVNNSLEPLVHASGIISRGRIVYRHKQKIALPFYIHFYLNSFSYACYGLCENHVGIELHPLPSIVGDEEESESGRTRRTRDREFLWRPECTTTFLVFSLFILLRNKTARINRHTIHDAMQCMTRPPFVKLKTRTSTGHAVHARHAWWPCRVTRTTPSSLPPLLLAN
jgi:hypothetical protein